MAKRIPTKERRDPSRFFSQLSSAFYELVLIILLLILALLSYAVQKFAHYCKLPTPCMLCSRLDRKKPYFHKDLMCNAHKMEISSLVYCRAHMRLANAHKMCDSCLLSFLSKVSKSLRGCPNGKFLGKDEMKAPLTKKDLTPGSLSRRSCSCCSAPVKNIPTAHRLLQSKHITVPDASLSGLHLSNGLPKGSEHCLKSLPVDHPFKHEAGCQQLTHGTGDVKEELLSRCLQAGPGADIPKNSPEDISGDKVTEKLVQNSYVMPAASASRTEKRVQVSDSHSAMGIAHGLEEITWSHVEVKPNILVSSEVTLEQVPTEALTAKLEVLDKSGLASNGDAIKALNSADLGLRTRQIMNEKLSSGLKAPSAEFATGKESSRGPEDLKARLSQMPPARWLDVHLNEMSSTPRANGHGDESKLSDASSSSVLASHARKLMGDRYESGMDCCDGSFISEIEGENAVDRLTRQIEMDRKCMCVLYKELEEERNAAEIAANQAMAMINRLQEEKASMHMEALQYLRMMEEQTEYDQEALQNLNDLLDDREKEIQDLEVLVESYRKQFGGEPLLNRVLESPSDCGERDYTEYTPVSTPRFMRSRGREVGNTPMRNTKLDFEDEKVYISESLKRLERKLRLVSNNGAYAMDSELSLKDNVTPRKRSLLGNTIFENPEYPKPVVDDDLKLLQQCNVTQENSQKAESKKFQHIEASQIKKSSTLSVHAFNFSFKDALIRENRLRSASYNERMLQMGGKKNDITDFGNEISQLSVRLEALEEDRNFLEQAVSSLKNGSSGIQFVQEIACHLRELRKIGSTHQEHIVP